MSKFIVTRDSYFEPLSYDEIVKPLAELQTQHNAAQEAYDKMAMDTAALENYISKEGKDDARAREMYNNYKTKLQTLQDNLWANGINAQTRRDLSAARNAYASDITRLAKAVESRQARSKEYWEARHNNPDLVTGADPGLAGLDKYLDNDRYGQDYFSYNSAQLENDIAGEWKTRASEMLRGLQDPNSVVKNPRLAGILTRVVHEGLTNGELREASMVADSVRDLNPTDRSQFYAQNGVSDVAQLMVESLLSRYDATGIRQSDASDYDRQRLFERGKAGWASGVLGTKYKDIDDPYFAQQMELQTAAMKQAIEDGQNGGGSVLPNETNTTTIAGDASKAKNIMDGFGKESEKMTYKGKSVRPALAIANEYYSGDAMQRYQQILGFNPGRDPHEKSASRYLTGEINGKDGSVYETRYNPNKVLPDGTKGGVEIRKKGSGQDWNAAPVAQNLTRIYRQARKEYEDGMKSFEKKHPEAAKALRRGAYKNMDPDSQYEFYKKHGISPETSLLDLEDALMAMPGYAASYPHTDTFVIQDGSDNGGYRAKLGDYIATNMVVNDKSADKNRQWRAYDDQAGHLHKIGENERPERKAIKDPDDVFDFKDGHITNIRDIALDRDAILNGYIKISTANKGKVAVGLDMIKSDRIKNAFRTAKDNIQYIINTAPAEERDERIQQQISRVASEIRSVVGYINAYQDKGNTNKDDLN